MAANKENQEPSRTLAEIESLQKDLDMDKREVLLKYFKESAKLTIAAFVVFAVSNIR